MKKIIFNEYKTAGIVFLFLLGGMLSPAHAQWTGTNPLVTAGNIQIGNTLTFNATGNPYIFTGMGTVELNRYLHLLNSANAASASGLKAGGILISDSYNYAYPGKNDLVVKGAVGIGTPTLEESLNVNGNINVTGSYIRFPHAYGDLNDGKIGNSMFAQGLNMVGINNDNTYRKIRVWGEITQQQNDGINTWAGENNFTGNINMPATNATGTAGVFKMNGFPFIHRKGISNTFMGTYAGNGMSFATNTGYSNSAFGHTAMYSITSGNDNVAMGYRAMYFLTTGVGNVAIGASALMFANTQSGNIAIGRLAQESNNAGSNNVAIGQVALRQNTNGSGNVAIGGTAGFGINGQNNTVCIGRMAGSSMYAGNNKILIGNEVNDLGIGDNQLNIGNWIYGNNGNIGIGVSSPTVKLDVAGTIKATSIELTNGLILNNYLPRYNSWGATGDGGAAITNDNNAFKALMMVGNYSFGSGLRHVKIFDRLILPNGLDNRKLVLYDNDPAMGSHAYYGLGIQAAEQRYNVPDGAKHAFTVSGSEALSINNNGVRSNQDVWLNSVFPSLYLQQTGVASPRRASLRLSSQTYNDGAPNAASKAMFEMWKTGNAALGWEVKWKYPTDDANRQTYMVAQELCISAGSTCDYVFKEEYKLRSIEELEAFITENKHLPGVKNDKEVKQAGMISLNELTSSLLEKVEELSLYTIQLNKKIKELSSGNEALKKLEQRIAELEQSAAPKK
jgi:trimeric autotransporter adhesin